MLQGSFKKDASEHSSFKKDVTDSPADTVGTGNSEVLSPREAKPYWMDSRFQGKEGDVFVPPGLTTDIERWLLVRLIFLLLCIWLCMSGQLIPRQT